jgi:hypothetical protein
MPVDAAALVEMTPNEVAPTLEVAWPVLGTAARHGLAGEILSVIEPHSEADPVAILVSLLAAFGALVGAGPHARADGAEHPARVWPLIIGDTSKSRKGSSWSQVRRVLAGADPSFAIERVLAGFGSGEGMVDAVAGDADCRLLMVEPEFARVLSVSKRDGSTLPMLMRQAWDGGRLQVRSRSGTAVADNAHVVVIGHITRAELLAKLAESDALGGSLNRFVLIAVRRSKLLSNGGNLDDTDLADLIRKFVKFVQQARTVGTVRRTPEAEEYWATLYAQLADDDPGGLLGAIIARDAAQVLRMSVTYALLDGAKMIDVAHIQAAEAVWDYSRASAASIFGQRTGDRVADLILDELQSRGNEGLDQTGIHDLLGRNVKADRIKQAVEVLVSHGLTKETKKNTHTRGRPKTVLLPVSYEENEVNEVNGQPGLPSDDDIERWASEDGEKPTPNLDELLGPQRPVDYSDEAF